MLSRGWTPPPSAQGYSAWRQGGWQPTPQGGALAAAVQAIPGLSDVSARAEPDWSPGVALEDGLKATIHYFKTLLA